jgi:hypothetical protein
MTEVQFHTERSNQMTALTAEDLRTVLVDCIGLPAGEIPPRDPNDEEEDDDDDDDDDDEEEEEDDGSEDPPVVREPDEDES